MPRVGDGEARGESVPVRCVCFLVVGPGPIAVEVLCVLSIVMS